MALDLSGLTQDQQIAKTAAYAGVPESVVRGQWRVESANGTARKDADGLIRSSAGALGDFQIMPANIATWEQRNGRKYDMRNFQDSAELYADVMKESMGLAKGDVTTALRIYQGGPNRSGWGKYNEAYAPAVYGGEATASSPSATLSGGTRQTQLAGMLAAAVRGDGSQLGTTWGGADVPAALRGDAINDGLGGSNRAAKEHIGKLREGLADLASASAVASGATDAEAARTNMAARSNDQLVPWWASQEVGSLDDSQNADLRRRNFNVTGSDRDEAVYRDSLSKLDKFLTVYEDTAGSVLARKLLRDFEDQRPPTPQGWKYDPKEWEEFDYTDDELSDIRDASYSPAELAQVREDIYARRHGAAVTSRISGAENIAYGLSSGLLDPTNALIGVGTSASAAKLAVGSARFFSEGRAVAGVASTIGENVVASGITNGALMALGEHRTLGDWVNDAAFSAAFSTAFSIGGLRDANVARDKAIVDLATGNAAMYGDQLVAEMRTQAELELGAGANPVLLNRRVNQLAQSKIKGMIQDSLADIPDDFRVFARPDVAVEDTAAPSTGARDNNIDQQTGLYNETVGGETPLHQNDPLLERAWKTAGVTGDINKVLQYLESTRSVPEDYRAIANALKRSGRLNDVKVVPSSSIDSWFPADVAPNVAGAYQPSLNAMAMRTHSPEGVLHEMFHAATVKELRANKAFGDEMEELLLHVNNSIGSVDSTLTTALMEQRINQGASGFLSTADELISYGLTNRSVQAVLRQMPAPGGTKPSAWEWLKDKIARVFGLQNRESALERLMSVVGDNLGADIRAPQAASQAARGFLVNSIFKTNRERKAFMDRSGISTQAADAATRVQMAEVIARAERFSSEYAIDAAKLTTIMSRIGLESTSTTLMSSKSPVARMLAITLLENPEGAAGRHPTAAMDRKSRFESYMGTRPRQYEAAYRLWRGQERGAGAVRDFMTGYRMRDEFDYAVKLYRETRYMGGDMEVPDVIRQFAKSLDDGYNLQKAEQRAVGTVGNNRLAEEDIEGYESRTWSGDRIRDAGVQRRESIRNALKDQFNVMGELYGDKFLNDFSIKYLERIEERAVGINRSPENLYSEGHADTLRDTLKALSLNEEQIQQVLGRYSRGGAKHTKSRIELDVTRQYTDEGGSFRLMDYLDNRVMDNYRKYAGRVSGDVALAKYGIMGDAGISILRKSMMATGATELEMKVFDQVMSEFTGRVIGTGDPTVLANARLLTSAIQLGGAGINQLAEYSNLMPALGLSGTFEALRIAPRMRKEINMMLEGKSANNGILEGFEFMSGRGAGLAGYDLHMFNTVDTQASLYGSERAGFFTALVQRAAHANRILSGQRAILAVQQRGVAELLIGKAAKFLRDGKAADPALKDMGLDDVLLDRLRGTMDRVVTWGADGKLEAVDPRKLDTVADRQAWLAMYQAVERGSGQILQEAFIGETGRWIHNGWLKLLLQHRSFPILAQQKQMGRNLGIYGAWGTAGIMLSAMAFVAPIQALRLLSRAALLPSEEREQAISDSMSPLALARSTMNYISSAGIASDAADLVGGVAGGWYAAAAGEQPDWLRQLNGGQLGSRKEIIGGSFAPALGVANDAVQAASGNTDNLMNLLPGGRLPYILPLMKGAAAQAEKWD